MWRTQNLIIQIFNKKQAHYEKYAQNLINTKCYEESSKNFLMPIFFYISFRMLKILFLCHQHSQILRSALGLEIFIFLGGTDLFLKN